MDGKALTELRHNGRETSLELEKSRIVPPIFQINSTFTRTLRTGPFRST